MSVLTIPAGFSQARRQVALAMVVNWFFGSTNSLLSDLTIVVRVSHNNSRHISAVGMSDLTDEEILSLNKAKAECLADIHKIVAVVDKLFGESNNAHVTGAIKSAKVITENHFDWHDVHRRVLQLRTAIETELNQHFYYQYPMEKGQVLFRWKQEWGDVVSAFPNAEYDVFSCVDCYALEHSTASVFHAMRVAEVGLRSIANERSLTLPKR